MENEAKTTDITSNGTSPNDEKNDPNKKRSRKRIALVVGSTLAVAVLGSGSGVLAAMLLKSGNSGSGGATLSAETYDETALMELFEQVKAVGGDYTESLKGWQMADIGIIQYSHESYTQTISVGSAIAAVVSQQIRSAAIRYEDTYFEESLSRSSVVGTAWRMYQVEDTTTQYPGSDIAEDATSATWDSMGTSYSKEEYLNLMGNNLDNHVVNYNITSKTVLKTATLSGDYSSAVRNEDGTYTVDLELNVGQNEEGSIPAIDAYRIQMKQVSSLLDYPTFDYSHLTFHLSANLELMTLKVHEKYKARAPQFPAAAMPVEATLVTQYSYGKAVEIPGLSTPIDYPASIE